MFCENDANKLLRNEVLLQHGYRKMVILKPKTLSIRKDKKDQEKTTAKEEQRLFTVEILERNQILYRASRAVDVELSLSSQGSCVIRWRFTVDLVRGLLSKGSKVYEPHSGTKSWDEERPVPEPGLFGSVGRIGEGRRGDGHDSAGLGLGLGNVAYRNNLTYVPAACECLRRCQWRRCSLSEWGAGDRCSIPDEVMNYCGYLTRNSRSYLKQVFIFYAVGYGRGSNGEKGTQITIKFSDGIAAAQSDNWIFQASFRKDNHQQWITRTSQHLTVLNAPGRPPQRPLITTKDDILTQQTGFHTGSTNNHLQDLTTGMVVNTK
ncbi:hypothetical protein OUZ56_029848 [Daphnia magna]|uniref:Uncharacterized protein n=1 Tax=Daphnia magna TaxID=35525 RepID=A0ABR0B819_9CRUS|nr:hypothetical protein OUZ56_029848 [Daphnia magna]